MYRLMTVLLLALASGAAAAYPIDLEVRADELNVTTVVHADGRLAVIEVSNHEPYAVRCEALFRNGPEQGRSRRAIIESGTALPLTWMPRREVVRLRVELRCEPHH
jgi:hypothetical protein